VKNSAIIEVEGIDVSYLEHGQITNRSSDDDPEQNTKGAVQCDDIYMLKFPSLTDRRNINTNNSRSKVLYQYKK
jgi:hypothetical protein